MFKSHVFRIFHYQYRFLSGNIYSQLSLTVLKNHGFNDIQSEKILKELEHFNQAKTYEIIDRSLICWKKNVWPNKGDHNETITLFTEVFCEKEIRLLFLSQDDIINRIENIRNLDLVRGTNDIWKVFQKSPGGYFLQDWKEFLKKYFYITYKIMPYITEKNIAADQIHPLVEYPEVMELSYETIKTRFLFAQRTGFKVTNNRKINLKTLFLVSDKDFLALYAPYCTMGEYKAMEKLSSSKLGQEDDDLFNDLVELFSSSSQRKTSSQRSIKNSKKFLEKTIKEGILLSSVK